MNYKEMLTINVNNHHFREGDVLTTCPYNCECLIHKILYFLRIKKRETPKIYTVKSVHTGTCEIE